ICGGQGGEVVSDRSNFCPRCLIWGTPAIQARREADRYRAALTASRERCKALEGALRAARDEITWWTAEHGCCGGHETDTLALIDRALLRQGEGQAGETRTPKFAQTSCSQCGRDFGPGDHGYSHCADHAERETRT